ncbi:MAG TPA: HNH endonuclease [Gemmatimonadaceae bacterium]|nr:HNH endonuclease [Gemmatimonadaceae bacterium]
MRARRPQLHRRTPPARKSRRTAPPTRPQPYGSIPRWRVRALKATALVACRRSCAYCARHLTLDEATLDHVLPRCLGGATTVENVVTACYRCNVLKGGRAPYDFFFAHPWAAHNFLRLATRIARARKGEARTAVSLAYAVAA